MNSNDFQEQGAGRIVQTLEGHFAFVPNKLPPRIEIDWELTRAISEADRGLAQLSGAASKLPNPHLLIIPFTRKEAVLSSAIEGTVASLSDLLSYEALRLFPEDNPREDKGDVEEVANYVRAMELGLERMRQFPISLRMIRELHERLLRGVRGESKMPGEFRTRQNWLGPPNTKIEEATYVPPPVSELNGLLDDFEKYIHSDLVLPPLVKMAVLHYQFEAIHPFLDGNGRIGRLLVTLLMVAEGLLSQPLLYLSAYFERYRSDYYSRLLAVSQQGAWKEWLEFFLRGVAEQSRDALTRANNLMTLNHSYRQRLGSRKRTSAHLLTLLDMLFSRPVVTTKIVARELHLTPASAQQHIDRLVQDGVLREATGKMRYRVYIAPDILQVIDI